MDRLLGFARRIAFMNLPISRRLRWLLFKALVDARLATFFKRRFDLYYQPGISLSVPPPEVYIKVGGATRDDFDKLRDPKSSFDLMYYSLGGYDILRFLQLVEQHGGNVRNLGTIFELGCGTGRLIQRLQTIEGVRLIGSDLNPEMIDWCKKTIPGATFFKNDVEPSLTFLEDSSVDLAYCYSVFTHIPLDLQIPWLQELRRVLRPGGFLICTVAGWHLQRQFVSPEDAETLRTTGRLEYTSSDVNASLATKVGGSAWDVYQTRSEVVRVFGSVLTLRDYVTIGQDVLVLQK